MISQAAFERSSLQLGLKQRSMNYSYLSSRQPSAEFRRRISKLRKLSKVFRGRMSLPRYCVIFQIFLNDQRTFIWCPTLISARYWGLPTILVTFVRWLNLSLWHFPILHCTNSSKTDWKSTGSSWMWKSMTKKFRHLIFPSYWESHSKASTLSLRKQLRLSPEHRATIKSWNQQPAATEEKKKKPLS